MQQLVFRKSDTDRRWFKPGEAWRVPRQSGIRHRIVSEKRGEIDQRQLTLTHRRAELHEAGRPITPAAGYA